jgi:hypothetical protein
MLKLGEALALAEVVKPSAPGEVANSVEKNMRARMTALWENDEEQGYNPQGRVWRELREDSP